MQRLTKKVIRAKVPVLVSKSVPTAQSAALARNTTSHLSATRGMTVSTSSNKHY